MLIHRGEQQAQSVDLLRHRAVVDELPLMEVVELIQEELHVAGLFGQNQAALLFRDGIVLRERLEGAVRDRIAANIAQRKGRARPALASERPAQFKCAADAVARLPKCHDLIPPFGPRASVSSIDVNHDNVTARRPDGTRVRRLHNRPICRRPVAHAGTF